jgi:hypothetical protein
MPGHCRGRFDCIDEQNAFHAERGSILNLIADSPRSARNFLLADIIEQTCRRP